MNNRLDDLLLQIQDPNIEINDWTKIVFEIGNLKDSKGIEPLYKLFCDESVNIDDKPTLAMALSRLGAQIIVPQVVSFIKDVRYRGNRAAFLASLLKLNCKDYFLEFVDIVSSADWECLNIAYCLIDKYADDIQEDIKKQSLALLSSRHLLIEKQLSEEYNEEIEDIMLFIEDTQNRLINA